MATIPSRRLRVVIRDVSPMVNLQEPVTHRSVEILLTEEQLSKLTTGRWEEVSLIFFEPVD